VDLDPETARKNLVFGWALFGVFVLLFAATIAVALVYLAFAD
jgi:nitrogen fixation protein FixH